MFPSLLKTPIKFFPILRPLRSLHRSSISKTLESEVNPTSSSVSYLATAKNPDSVLNSLKSYGFNDTQVSNISRKCPILLSSNWDKTLKPKLDYLRAFGYSDTELTDLVSSVPYMITSSLENRLKPNFELLSSIIGNTQQIASAVRQTSRLIQGNLETNFLPNVRTLQSCGVPDASIAKLAGRHPRVAMMSAEQFKVKVELVREMGFNPLSTMFVNGVAALSRFKPSAWDTKMELYKSLGWSETEVCSAFVKHPFVMVISEQKIRKAMDFFVKKRRWEPSVMATNPVVLCLSLEKRVMPRCSVLDVLESEGLEVRGSGVSFLLISEKDFLNKYVTKYKKKVPAVLEAYKINLESVRPEKGSLSVGGS